MTSDDTPDIPKLEELKLGATDEQGREDTSRSSGGISGSISGTPANDGTGSAGSSPTGKKRGRKPGSKNKPKDGATGQSDILPKPLVLFAIKAPYDFASKRYGPHWALSDAEAEAMVPAHMALANEYLPDWLKEHAALYTALSFHAIAIVSRSVIEMQIRQQQAEANPTQEKEAKPPNPVPESSLQPVTGPINAGSSNDTRDDGYGKVIFSPQETLPQT